MFEGKRISTVGEVEYGLFNKDEYNDDNYHEVSKLPWGTEATGSPCFFRF